MCPNQPNRDFATQQYFDSSGFFTAMVICFPLLLNLVFMTAIWVANTGSMMVTVKRAQFKHEARERAKAGGSNDKGGGGGGGKGKGTGAGKSAPDKKNE